MSLTVYGDLTIMGDNFTHSQSRAVTVEARRLRPRQPHSPSVEAPSVESRSPSVEAPSVQSRSPSVEAPRIDSPSPSVEGPRLRARQSRSPTFNAPRLRARQSRSPTFNAPRLRARQSRSPTFEARRQRSLTAISVQAQRARSIGSEEPAQNLPSIHEDLDFWRKIFTLPEYLLEYLTPRPRRRLTCDILWDLIRHFKPDIRIKTRARRHQLVILFNRHVVRKYGVFYGI